MNKKQLEENLKENLTVLRGIDKTNLPFEVSEDGNSWIIVHNFGYQPRISILDERYEHVPLPRHSHISMNEVLFLCYFQRPVTIYLR